MDQATELNTTTPMPGPGQVAMQMEGLTLAFLFTLCFGWQHLQSGIDFMSARVLVTFFSGLVVVPVLTGLPLVFVRRMMMELIGSQPSLAAYATFAHVALYGLQGVLVWVVTREGYVWFFARTATP